MADTILFANNATSTLAGSISNVATTCTLASGTGALFPNPGADEYFVMTFTDNATGLVNEIVHVTARSGDVLTIERAQEGTSAVAWTAGDLASALITAGMLEDFQQTANNSGRLLGIVKVTASGSVSLPAGTNTVIVEGAGGGGGGGAAATTASGEFSCGSGGGGAGTGKFLITSGLTSLVATIGAAGTGGVTGVNSGNGTDGGDTTLTGGFGGITFPKGYGGNGSAAFNPPFALGGGGGGAAPAAIGATEILAVLGDPGGLGSAFTVNNGYSGVGGSSPYGSGGGEVGSSANGSVGSGFGAGGSGGLNIESQVTARTGGAGTPGVLIFTCYS